MLIQIVLKFFIFHSPNLSEDFLRIKFFSKTFLIFSPPNKSKDIFVEDHFPKVFYFLEDGLPRIWGCCNLPNFTPMRIQKSIEDAAGPANKSPLVTTILSNDNQHKFPIAICTSSQIAPPHCGILYLKMIIKIRKNDHEWLKND